MYLIIYLYFFKLIAGLFLDRQLFFVDA